MSRNKNRFQRRKEGGAMTLDEVLDDLSKCYRACFEPGHSRTGFYEYLVQIYRRVHMWRNARLRNRRAAQLCKILAVDLQFGTDVYRLLIDASTRPSHGPNIAKRNSLWARALRAAHQHGVRPKDLAGVLEKSGGPAGLVRAAQSVQQKRPGRLPSAPGAARVKNQSRVQGS
jgi:hypothetical protein